MGDNDYTVVDSGDVEGEDGKGKKRKNKNKKNKEEEGDGEAEEEEDGEVEEEEEEQGEEIQRVELKPRRGGTLSQNVKISEHVNI